MQLQGPGAPKARTVLDPTPPEPLLPVRRTSYSLCLFFLLSQIVALWSSRFKFSQEDCLLASICYSPLFRLSILHQTLISYWPVHGLVVLRSGLALHLVRHQLLCLISEARDSLTVLSTAGHVSAMMKPDSKPLCQARPRDVLPQPLSAALTGFS